MKTSRRIFLGGVAASAATLLSFRTTGLNKLSPWREPILDCTLLDLNSHYLVRESVKGYQAALPGEHNLVETLHESTRRYRFVIVPALGSIDPAVAQKLSNLLKAGTHLLLESGAGFLSPAEFFVHQRILRRYFGVTVLPPSDLWPGKFADNFLFSARNGCSEKKLNSHKSIPYVNYAWPRDTKVRDFSRVIPVSSKAGDVIGRVGTLPVALKKRVANGTLIFLGSPLGPALFSGDPEARSWLRLVAAPDRRSETGLTGSTSSPFLTE
jgi:hypothetical protein